LTLIFRSTYSLNSLKSRRNAVFLYLFLLTHSVACDKFSNVYVLSSGAEMKMIAKICDLGFFVDSIFRVAGLEKTNAAVL
jgi:hypothetical protein